MTRSAGIWLGIVLGAGSAAPAAAQESWREALDRFERGLDDLLDEVAELDELPAPLGGLYVPASDDPGAAAELPSAWVALGASERPPARLVVLVHGLDEPGDIWCDLAPALVRAGHEVARFEYHNDQGVVTSAGELLGALRAARGLGVGEVALVAHSMGGLVAFEALTSESGYAGDISGGGNLPRVTRLIAVGTPWAGSPWAKLRPAAEIREQVQRWMMDQSWDLRPLLDYRRDGTGQAAADLAERSALVTGLAARDTPRGLELTNIAGHIVQAEPVDLGWVRESRLLRELMSEDDLGELAEGLREASSTLGDGVVPVASALAREEGDNVIFPVNHRALIRETPVDFITGPTPDGPPGIAVILDRLAEDGAAPEPDDRP
ncbi:MAG TPA: alpha/beta fold hydrolase [Phycisphaerales bacterium]|nr:alpha/beta fold hydrolase [Phycisphaerales bacterium]